jgi:hypothetical protein
MPFSFLSSQECDTITYFITPLYTLHFLTMGLSNHKHLCQKKATMGKAKENPSGASKPYPKP